MRVRIAGAGLAALVLALAIGCGDDAEREREPRPSTDTPAPVTTPRPPARDPFADATEIRLRVPKRHRRGRAVAASSGCLACHTLGTQGNRGPGPDLTRVGARLSARAIERALVEPRSPMPSFARLREEHPRRFEQLVAFLASLR